MSPTLYHNGTIVTLDHGPLAVRDLLVSGACIAEVGNGITPPAHSATVDLERRVVLPAFTDSHVHLLQTGLMLAGVDVSTVQTEAELCDVLLDSLTHKKGRSQRLLDTWGYDPRFSLPTKDTLDAISTERPLFVRRRDGHSSAVNSAALAMLLPVLRGQADDVDDALGLLKGRAHVMAEQAVLDLADPTDLEQALHLVSQQAISRGVVAIASLTHRADWAAFLLDRREETPLDVDVFLESWTPEDARRLGFMRVGGCLLLDGSFGSHTAALEEPYADAPTTRGHLYHTSDELLAFLEEANRLGMQTAFHAIGDRAVRQLVAAHEACRERDPQLRHRVEHAELLSDWHLDHIKQTNLVLSMQPAFEREWGGADNMYGRRLGQRTALTNRFRSIMERGIPLAFGSDSYITPIHPLRGVQAAVQHPNPHERLTLIEALGAFTTGGAYATFAETRRGVLRAGMEASFVVLEDDPFRCEATHIGDIEVALTVYRGRRVYERQQTRV